MSAAERKLVEAAAMILGRDEAEQLLQAVKDEYPMEMRMCEQNCVMLKPNQPYIFTVDPTCDACKAAADLATVTHEQH